MSGKSIAYATHNEATPRVAPAMPGTGASPCPQDPRRTGARATLAAQTPHRQRAHQNGLLHIVGVLVAVYITSFALAASVVAPQKAQAAGDGDKIKTPVVSEFEAQRENSVWDSVIDAPQGRDIPFRVQGTMPVDLANRDQFEYWLIAEFEGGFDLMEASPAVTLVHQDGTTRDVTSLLTVSIGDRTIVAGSSDVIRSISGLEATDRLMLTYNVRLNEKSRLGLERGNASHAHVEYSRDEQTVEPSSSTSQASSSSALRGMSTGGAHMVAAMAADTTAPATQGPRTVGSTAQPSGLHLAAQGETRSTGLVWSTEITSVIYTYQIDVMTTIKGQDVPLPGARFALQNDSGQWYVAGKDWSSNQADATVMATDADGRASFRNVGSGTYQVVELSAPFGFQAVDPISVTVQVEKREDAELALHASSVAAENISAEARSGIISVAVQNAATTNEGGSNPGTTDGSTGGNGRNASGATGANGTRATNYDPLLPVTGTAASATERSPQTGDILAPVLEITLISVLVILCGVMLRRGAAGSQEDSR